MTEKQIIKAASCALNLRGSFSKHVGFLRFHIFELYELTSWILVFLSPLGFSHKILRYVCKRYRLAVKVSSGLGINSTDFDLEFTWRRLFEFSAWIKITRSSYAVFSRLSNVLNVEHILYLFFFFLISSFRIYNFFFIQDVPIV